MCQIRFATLGNLAKKMDLFYEDATPDEPVGSINVYFTIGYLLVAACLVAPPTEFVSAGLTVQNLFSNFLGSEDIKFIQYHMKRTTVTLVFHSLLPLGYYLGMAWCEPGLLLHQPLRAGYYWKLFLAVSVILVLCACILAVYWHSENWGNHPVAKLLAAHAPPGNTWRAVASSIDIEFRRIDKFTSGQPGRRLIVTDSWIMLTSTYSLYIAHQSDVHLTLEGTEEHELTHESTVGVQYLNIVVSSINESVKPFKIRLNALEYSDLKEKLQRPVRIARDVVIQQSLSDRFVAAFTKQVQENPVYRKPPDMDLEACIGCMQKPANIKLQKLCDGSQGPCVHCYCRPMWCLECMGKWYASRQDQQQPETWMMATSPCPTCRSTFCVLDVSLVQ